MVNIITLIKIFVTIRFAAYVIFAKNYKQLKHNKYENENLIICSIAIGKCRKN
jgi:hypothetical protein